MLGLPRYSPRDDYLFGNDSLINVLCRFNEVLWDRSDPIVESTSWEALKEMDDSYIHGFLFTRDCDHFEFRMNAPSVSRVGGTLRRQIRTVCSVLSMLLDQTGEQLDDKSIRTLMCETEVIVNSRQLTLETIIPPVAPEPSTPNDLLTLKSRVVLPSTRI